MLPSIRLVDLIATGAVALQSGFRALLGHFAALDGRFVYLFSREAALHRHFTALLNDEAAMFRVFVYLFCPEAALLRNLAALQKDFARLFSDKAALPDLFAALSADDRRCFDALFACLSPKQVCKISNQRYTTTKLIWFAPRKAVRLLRWTSDSPLSPSLWHAVASPLAGAYAKARPQRRLFAGLPFYFRLSTFYSLLCFSFPDCSLSLVPPIAHDTLMARLRRVPARR